MSVPRCRTEASNRANIQQIYLVHQLQGLFLANVLMQCAAEGGCNVIFAIRKRACPSESRHDGTCRTVDTLLDVLSVDRTSALFKHLACLKNRNPQRRISVNEFESGKDTARSCADNENIVLLHAGSPPFTGISERTCSRRRQNRLMEALAMASTSSWEWGVLAMPVAMLVMQAIPSTRMPR